MPRRDVLSPFFRSCVSWLADTRLAQVQSNLGAEVTTDVQDANRLLATIAALNFARDLAVFRGPTSFARCE
jgi:hypothetical protein